MSERAAPRSCAVRRARLAQESQKKSSNSFAQAPSSVVQKKVFQARLGDVHVEQLNACRGGHIRHFWNQRAATVGVQIGPGIIRRAHLPDPGKSLQPLEKLGRMYAEAYAH